MIRTASTHKVRRMRIRLKLIATCESGLAAGDGRVQSCADVPLKPLHPRW